MSEPRRHEPLPLGGEEGLPYSKGLMARALIAAGVSAERGLRARAARRARPAARGDGEASTLDRLEELAAECSATTRARRGRPAAPLPALQELDLPIILLLGGATGTGKSTVATEVAYRLGITRVTSTDFIRQTMRAFFSREFMPSIHYSSFEARRGAATTPTRRTTLLAGFLDQTRNVLVGVQAALERALQEGWSMVLEGVHLVPGPDPADRRARSSSSACSRSSDEDEHRDALPDPRRGVTGGMRPARQVPRATSPTSARSRTTSSSARGGTACRWSTTANVE